MLKNMVLFVTLNSFQGLITYFFTRCFPHLGGFTEVKNKFSMTFKRTLVSKTNEFLI